MATASIRLRDAARDDFCTALESVDADAPTLCEGWTAYDVAAHVWQLSHDPLAWPGVGLGAVRPLVALTRRRMDRVERRMSYGSLVRAIRDEPSSIGAMPLDGLERHRHAIGEYTVHAEDVRRPSGVEAPARSAELVEAIWRRAMRVARLFHARDDHPLVFERVDARGALVARFRAAEGRRAATGREVDRSGAGRSHARYVRGEPVELLLWVHGRRDAAAVETRDGSS